MIFGCEKVGADLHRRATVTVDSEQVRPSHIECRRREVNPASISRPRVEQFKAVVERNPFEIAGVDRQHVNVAIAGARRHERQSLAVW